MLFIRLVVLWCAPGMIISLLYWYLQGRYIPDTLIASVRSETSLMSWTITWRTTFLLRGFCAYMNQCQSGCESKHSLGLCVWSEILGLSKMGITSFSVYISAWFIKLRQWRESMLFYSLPPKQFSEKGGLLACCCVSHHLSGTLINLLFLTVDYLCWKVFLT